ncbi:glycine betaine ABC transporter substrate-binding protein [Fusibacter tunisiensis]|uniref:Glycine betaine/proline transport system substrate-binding protein n=1 Tax=Fusibacter tunisiensis TaxID=1008308 RepID=A0ABS2MSN6_9FIRM|nr:glycine betaine ABC transporter substrate-binding protein [Fusibacter tunisiensis]MBM7562410.1 glycine betaine/proline transport system substrate-binding protein [Fusibacter tunisiensis]
MFKKNHMKFAFVVITAFALVLAGCSTTSDDNGTQSVGEQLDYTITGIDAGAGVVRSAEQAVEDYGLNYTVQTSSGAAMTQALSDAIANEEAIVVTGWNPHWKFAAFDLKYLDDPKGSFGESENINSIARLGLSEDMPEAYQILDNFYWEGSDMENVMVKINDGESPKDVARQWVDENTDKVSVWTDGVDPVDGVEINLAYVAWDSEIASTNVIGTVLSDMGYNVTLTQVENGPMWEAVASGQTDAIVAAWLPGTHGDHYAKYEGEFDDLGANLEGARIGLVVPAYMEIDSIEDLID